jgi:hypothetical protein
MPAPRPDSAPPRPDFESTGSIPLEGKERPFGDADAGSTEPKAETTNTIKTTAGTTEKKQQAKPARRVRKAAPRKPRPRPAAARAAAGAATAAAPAKNPFESLFGPPR